jgi:hypothetical protein
MPTDGGLPPHLERIRHFSWDGFSFLLPPWWEATAYDFGAKTRLQFHERVRPQGRLQWRSCSEPPDLPRLMSEIHRRQLELDAPKRASSFAGLTNSSVGAFAIGIAGPGEPFQAALHMSREKLLVQWTFPEYRADEFEQIHRPLLESFSCNHGPARRWELFGIRLRLPEAFAFNDITPEPAHVTIAFETAKHLRLLARRVGMPEASLEGGTLAALVRRLLRRDGARVTAIEERDVLGCPGVRMDFDRRGQRGLEKLTGRWWPGEAWAWHDRVEGRIYSLEQVGPPKQPRVALVDACDPNVWASSSGAGDV